MKSGPHLPQLEKALAQKRRPNTAINKINKQILKKKKKRMTIVDKFRVLYPPKANLSGNCFPLQPLLNLDCTPFSAMADYIWLDVLAGSIIFLY